MKKRTFKKLVMGMAIMVLFSSTMVFGAEYNFSLNPTQTLYSTVQIKSVDDSYAKVNQMSSSGTIQYTVVNTSNTPVSVMKKITGSNYGTLSYPTDVLNGILGSRVKLRGYNAPGDNNGSIRNASGTWTP